MTKTKTTFFCQNCGTQHAKWVGQCGACKEWNTIVEEVIQKEEKRVWKQSTTAKQTVNKPLKIADIQLNPEERVVTNNNELDTVLGGGLVKGSVTLLGGEPGIGKSTLLLQVALNISQKVLYVSGEESQSQIKMRAERLEANNSNCLILTETSTQQIFKNIEETVPDVLVIDSIQTLHTNSIEASPGTISQIRETAAELIKYAKETATPVLLIGHINKDGHIAGPKILEHMVDVVLQFEGDRNHTYRTISTAYPGPHPAPIRQRCGPRGAHEPWMPGTSALHGHITAIGSFTSHRRAVFGLPARPRSTLDIVRFRRSIRSTKRADLPPTSLKRSNDWLARRRVRQAGTLRH